MNHKYKYPRTPHLQNSPGASSDDIFSNVNFKNKEIVITEKLDGENTTLYSDYYHARSIDSKHHESQSWLKRYHSEIKYQIPLGWRLCGENLYATHSIEYTNLKSYFLLFSIWENDTCLNWKDTLEFANILNLNTVPILYTGIYKENIINTLISNLDLTKQEGIVIRLASSFKYNDFNKSCAKWVRANHVQTSTHWKDNKIKLNKLS